MGDQKHLINIKPKKHFFPQHLHLHLLRQILPTGTLRTGTSICHLRINVVPSLTTLTIRPLSVVPTVQTLPTELVTFIGVAIALAVHRGGIAPAQVLAGRLANEPWAALLTAGAGVALGALALLNEGGTRRVGEVGDDGAVEFHVEDRRVEEVGVVGGLDENLGDALQDDHQVFAGGVLQQNRVKNYKSNTLSLHQKAAEPLLRCPPVRHCAKRGHGATDRPKIEPPPCSRPPS